MAKEVKFEVPAEMRELAEKTTDPLHQAAASRFDIEIRRWRLRSCSADAKISKPRYGISTIVGCVPAGPLNETSTVRQLKTAACDVKFVTVPIRAGIP